MATFSVTFSQYNLFLSEKIQCGQDNFHAMTQTPRYNQFLILLNIILVSALFSVERPQLKSDLFPTNVFDITAKKRTNS